MKTDMSLLLTELIQLLQLTLLFIIILCFLCLLLKNDFFDKKKKKLEL